MFHCLPDFPFLDREKKFLFGEWDKLVKNESSSSMVVRGGGVDTRCSVFDYVERRRLGVGLRRTAASEQQRGLRDAAVRKRVLARRQSTREVVEEHRNHQGHGGSGLRRRFRLRQGTSSGGFFVVQLLI